MGLKLGNTNSRVYRGGVEIHKIYTGDTLMYRSIFTYIESYRTTSDFYGSNIENENNAQTLMQDLRNKDLFDNASFVMIPSATRFGRVGVQLPERPYNLFQFSEQIENSIWIKANSTVSANVTIAPNGQLTADKLIANATSNQHSITSPSVLIKPNTSYTLSIYAKASEYPNVVLSFPFSSFGSVWYYGSFNLQNGTISGGNTTRSIEDIGNGWYRCSITRQSTIGSTSIGLQIKLSDNANNTSQGPSFLGDGTSGIFIWGAQLVENTQPLEYQKTVNTDFDLTFTRASTATRVNSAGLVESSPRNLLQRSEEFDNASWTKNNTTATGNTSISPNGTLTAERITSITVGDLQRFVSIAVDVKVGTTYTASVYAKADGSDFIQMFGNSAQWGLNYWCNFDVRNGVIGSKGTLTTATITSVGNGWYRCVITGSPQTADGSNSSYAINFVESINSSRNPTTTSTSTSVLLWGAQFEIDSTATDYVATTDRLNHPRIDYSSGVPSLLLEPQRTNLVFPSNILTNQSRTVTAVAHTLSFYGTGTVTLSGVFSGSLVGTGANNRVTLTFTPTAGTLTLTISGNVTDAQLEAGAYATSYIPTTTATVTRVADSYTRNNVFTNGLISAQGGTWFVELINNIVLTRDAASGGIVLGLGSDAIEIRASNAPNSRLYILKNVSGSNTTIHITTANTVKLAIKWNSTTADVFENGIKVVTATSFTPTVLENLNATNTDVPKNIKQMALWNKPLTDTQCISLSTL